MIEQWKPIDGWKDLYEVSNVGRIHALERTVYFIDGRIRIFPEHIMVNQTNPATGYVMVPLSRDNRTRHYYVHRLVAKAFVPNPENKKYVNHLDGIRCHNTFDNLEWSTHQENIQHAYATGLARILRGEEKPNVKVTWQAAHQLRTDVWNVVQAWAIAHDVHTQTAWDIIAGRNWIKPPEILREEERRAS